MNINTDDITVSKKKIKRAEKILLGLFPFNVSFTETTMPTKASKHLVDSQTFFVVVVVFGLFLFCGL